MNQEQPNSTNLDDVVAQIAHLKGLIQETRLRASQSWREFLLWGSAVSVGYLVSAWGDSQITSKPTVPQVAWCWLGITTAAALIHTVSYRRWHRGPSGTLGRRLFRMNALLVAVTVIHPIVGHLSTKAMLAYFPFWVGLIYVVNGIFVGFDYVLIGGWIAISAVAAYYTPLWIEDLWLAAAVGGGLLTTSWLMRRRPLVVR